MVRTLGRAVAVRVAVVGGPPPKIYPSVPRNNFIYEHVFTKLRRLNIVPSALSTTSPLASEGTLLRISAIGSPVSGSAIHPRANRAGPMRSSTAASGPSRNGFRVRGEPASPTPTTTVPPYREGIVVTVVVVVGGSVEVVALSGSG